MSRGEMDARGKVLYETKREGSGERREAEKYPGTMR